MLVTYPSWVYGMLWVSSMFIFLPGFDLADPELQDIAIFQWDGLRGQLAHTELGTLQVTQTLHLCELGA